ncbi:MAG: nucleotide pyrophosphohydrolase [Halanaerobiales bacterium]|nr:nucleotide pyrophosphohydrolase [Halanaerobiales bacterium]
MDNETTINDLKNLVKEFCELRDWSQYHNPKDLSIGISTEANELLEIFRFKSDKELNVLLEDPKKRKLIENEIADVFFFLLRFAQMNNIDLETSLKNKVKINKEKYPTDLFKGSNKKYNEIEK